MHRIAKEKKSDEKPWMEKSYKSYLFGAIAIKSLMASQGINCGLKIALSVYILAYLWSGMTLKRNAKETLKTLNENGLSLKDITVKNIEGHSFRLRLKSEIQYLFKFAFLYKMFCRIYKIVA